MKLDWFVKLMLLLIMVFLAILVFRPVAQPDSVHAQPRDNSSLYVEPGYTMLRKPDGTAQMYGKVMIDMQTGDVWGFPTLGEVPYPVDTTKTEPPKSHPMYLGKFIFSEATR